MAGVNCIEAIREVDEEGKIVVISEEHILNYSRPLISYYLGGRIDTDKISFKDEDFYKEKKVNLLLNKKEDSLALYNQISSLNDPFWSNLAQEKIKEINFNSDKISEILNSAQKSEKI